MAKETKTQQPPEPAEVVSKDDEISEAEITAKVRAGLTRAQAVEVITNQRREDAAAKK